MKTHVWCAFFTLKNPCFQESMPHRERQVPINHNIPHNKFNSQKFSFTCEVKRYNKSSILKTQQLF